MKSEDNELLTRVGPGTPMGKMLRHHWLPAIRSEAVQKDGAPVRVRLFGEDFVAFRGTDGRVGFLDEACPHRGVSLALARNEDNGLRCIFHGWKLDVSGKVIDAPCEPADRRQAFCSNIRVRQYSVKEVAGTIWVYLGTGAVPAFPDFEFNGLPPDQVCIRRAVVNYNWLQGLEAHIDSSHVAFLHSGFLTAESTAIEPQFRANLAQMKVDAAPSFETNETPYGMQESALRNMGDGTTYARIREIVLPFVTFIPGPPGGQCNARISVPIDDFTSAEWYVIYDPAKPLTEEIVGSMFRNTSSNPDDFAADLGNSANLWGQDREAMKTGHFSGLTRNLFLEDFIVQDSMGSLLDRTKEQLGSADIIIVKVRRMLLDAVRKFEAGEQVRWTSGFEYRKIQARSVTFDSTKTWRDFAQGQAVQA
jgi:phenylpropionate dioxygenase-like ring-hydroxylating dioxygenase large terminal subunit